MSRLLILITVCYFFLTIQATTIYVSNVIPPSNCSNPCGIIEDCPCENLVQAMDTILSTGITTNITISVSSGIYYGQDNMNINFGELNITILGNGPENTIIDCNHTIGPVFNFNIFSNEQIVQGFTIKNCLSPLSGSVVQASNGFYIYILNFLVQLRINYLEYKKDQIQY